MRNIGYILVCISNEKKKKTPPPATMNGKPALSP
jgi:hypothetical protein